MKPWASLSLCALLPFVFPSSATNTSALQLKRSPDKDPTDFSWIKRWAAVGDSFTAGIGSGNVYSNDRGDVSCSRYDYSYPVILNQYFGPSVTQFKYSACSGATSEDISGQIKGLPSDLDLAVLTAGGNDLCLTSIIMKCILQSVTSESNCNKAITTAQDAIDNLLQSNVQDLLTSLDKKMNKDGIIVLASYAQYFDTSNDECTNQQDWVFPGQAGSTSLLLTKDRRSKFNTLVENTNKKLQAAVTAAAKNSKAKIVFADWDPWGESAKGRFCEQGASPDPFDKSNDRVLFFKLPTYKVLNPGLVMRDEFGFSGLETTSNVTSAMEEKDTADYLSALALDTREADVKQPACGKGLLSGALPDKIGKIFHPSKLGHEAMASFVSFAVTQARSSILGIDDPLCEPVNDLKCSQDSGSKQYASAYSLYLHTEEFCSSMKKNAPSGKYGWSYSKTYNKDTPDEATFSLELEQTASASDEKACNRAVNQILDGCDGNDKNNPMNWKFGGTYKNGGYTYKITPNRKKRPFPVPKKPTSSCTGSYKFVLDRYNIRGAGWASWDFGKDSLKPNSTHCFGKGLTGWYFEYFDEPDKNGYEWLAKFNSPIWTKARCYNNNKVQRGAGGPSSGGCS